MCCLFLSTKAQVTTFTASTVKANAIVATEKEILANNLNVGEMSATLLKKVEELTLYVVEQNKQLEIAKKEIENLKQQIKK